MHWRAVYFNRKRAECCFFDSLVSEPTEDVMRGIKMIMRKMADPLYIKFLKKIELNYKLIIRLHAGHLLYALSPTCMRVRYLKKLHTLQINTQTVRKALYAIFQNVDIYNLDII